MPFSNLKLVQYRKPPSGKINECDSAKSVVEVPVCLYAFGKSS
jgi:hypothetical protein